jgi:diguanylate cyclase (GGDEF)-like protein
MPPGVGITGACYAVAGEILVDDVDKDPRYRAALPGVASEFAVPLTVHGETVGVLNVDTVGPLTADDVARVRIAGRILSRRLEVVGIADRSNSALHELGRRAPRVAAGATPTNVAARTVEASVAVTNLESAAVWVFDDTQVHRLAEIGPTANCLTTLSDDEVRALDALAGDFTSCYSGGGALDLGFGPTQMLRERGAFAMLLTPLRDGDRRVGLMCAVSGTAADVESDTVEAVELLCLHAGSRLAALARLQQLQELVYRDALTHVASRMLWDELLDDRRGATRAIGWLATVDVDRFKHINDTEGHVAGDHALRAVAAELSAPPFSWDSVFRTGGDEFVVLIPPMPAEEAAEIATSMRERTAKVLQPLGADVSIGLSPVHDGQGGLRQAFIDADAGLYIAKNKGGAAVQLHCVMSQDIGMA